MNNHTILVIEDEDEARQILGQILEFEGFQVVGAANGAEALDYLRASEQPCLIVLDILMPVMDGRQFRAAMLKDQSLAQIPVVVVSALEPSAAADLAAMRVFKKPLDVNALIAVVKENC